VGLRIAVRAAVDFHNCTAARAEQRNGCH
jgi:hypothetical protein